MQNKILQWLDLFVESRRLYEQKDFCEARKMLAEYKNKLNYSLLPYDERRVLEQPEISVIIVSFSAQSGLIECLNSLVSQSNQNFEIILVDNGGNESVHAQLESFDFLHIKMPINVTPSEGRNIGAFFAKGDLFVFLDDDAIAEKGFMESVCNAFKLFKFLAIRGRVLPLNEEVTNQFPGHYDLGHYPIPAILETEGNAAVRADVWKQVGGMDSLLFGAEGAELSVRILNSFAGKDIYYWPEMLIYHDFPTGKGLQAKKKRHSLARQYFEKYCPEANDIAFQYGRWYQERPGTTVKYDQRTLGQKIKAALTEIYVRLKNKSRPDYTLPEINKRDQ